jgi:hypothetical protein
MSWFTNLGVMIIAFLAHVGGAFGFFNLSHNPPGLPKQLVVVSTISAHPIVPPEVPSSGQISPGSPVGSTTKLVRNPHNLYNLSTPTSYNPYGCYEQIGNTVVVILNGTPTTLPDADVETFQDLSVFDLCFGKDKKNVYYYDHVLPWADPSTFSVLWYARRPVMFLRNGNEIVSWNPSSDSTQLPSCPSVPSGGFCIVPGGDPNTFQTIPGAYDIAPWAKDKHNVYCAGATIQGADPSTVQLINENTYLRVTVDGRALTYNRCTIVSATST